jgi:hypothetical protein
MLSDEELRQRREAFAELQRLFEPLQPYFKARHREFDELIEELRQYGWTIDAYGDMVPVQMEGKLPDGRPFYLRCRYDTCSLRVGEVTDDIDAVIRRPRWSAEYADPKWEMFEAGYLEASEVRVIIRSLVASVRRSEENAESRGQA